jgi:hypothetical protein
MLREGLASRALKYRAVPVAQRIVDNDKVFRHLCTTMGWPPRLAQCHSPTSALSKLPNDRHERRQTASAAQLFGVRSMPKLDGCHLPWMQTEVLAHLKLHAVDLREVA